MSYGVRGSAVTIAMESYRLVYPTATDAELKKGAEWTLRISADHARFAAYEAMPFPEQQKELERQMFGDGDHSDKRIAE